MTRLSRLRVLVRYAQGAWHLGEGDVLLAAFPKSGSTWVRFVLCQLLSLRYWEGRELDFATLDATMPELGVDSLAEPWPWKELLPRVVKTHTPAWPNLGKVPAVLLVRNPMDVMVSLHHHDQGQAGLRLGDVSLGQFVRHHRFGVPGWVRHTHSWMERRADVIRYETLRADPEAGFATLLEYLGVQVPHEMLSEALARSTLEEVRRAEERGGLDPAKGFDPSFRFARRGGVGEGRETLSPDDQVWVRDYLRSHGVTLYE